MEATPPLPLCAQLPPHPLQGSRAAPGPCLAGLHTSWPPQTHRALLGGGTAVSSLSRGEGPRDTEGLPDRPRASVWCGLGLHLHLRPQSGASCLRIPPASTRKGVVPAYLRSPMRWTGVQSPGIRGPGSELCGLSWPRPSLGPSFRPGKGSIFTHPPWVSTGALRADVH